MSVEDEIRKFIKELEEMKWASQLRANDLTRSDELRAGHQATANAYAFVQLKLRMLV